MGLKIEHKLNYLLIDHNIDLFYFISSEFKHFLNFTKNYLNGVKWRLQVVANFYQNYQNSKKELKKS